jgi:hypothetical protein
MGMRRAQNLQVQQPLDRQIHRVARLAGHDGIGERIGQAGAECLAGLVRLDVACAKQRVVDRPITGAAAEVALQRVRQIGLLRVGQCHRGHDHAGGAIPALEGLRIVKRLLHRMEFAVSR